MNSWKKLICIHYNSFFNYHDMYKNTWRFVILKMLHLFAMIILQLVCWHSVKLIMENMLICTIEYYLWITHIEHKNDQLIECRIQCKHKPIITNECSRQHFKSISECDHIELIILLIFHTLLETWIWVINIE